MTTDRHQSPPTVDSPSLASGVGRVATLLLHLLRSDLTPAPVLVSTPSSPLESSLARWRRRRLLGYIRATTERTPHRRKLLLDSSCSDEGDQLRETQTILPSFGCVAP